MQKATRNRYPNGRSAPSPVQRTYYIRFCIALAVYIAAALLAYRAYGSDDALASLYGFLGGGVFVGNGSLPSPLVVLLACFPTFVFCCLFADFLQDGFSHAAESVFTRTTKRLVWLWHNLSQLFCFILVYTLLGGIMVTLIALFINGGTGGFANLAPSVISMATLAISLNVLTLFMLLILISLLSDRFSVVIGLISVIAIHLFCLLLCSSVPPAMASLLVPLLPSAQGVLAWHDTMFSSLMPQAFGVTGFALFYSYLYMLILIVVEVVVTAFYVKRREFI